MGGHPAAGVLHKPPGRQGKGGLVLYSDADVPVKRLGQGAGHQGVGAVLQLQLRHHSQLQAIRRKPLRMRKSQKRTMTISTYTASVTRKRMTTMILMIS